MFLVVFRQCILCVRVQMLFFRGSLRCSLILVHALTAIWVCVFSLMVWVNGFWTLECWFPSFEKNALVPRHWLNGFILPVLKHGPRSLGELRVFGWQTRTHNESNRLDFCITDRLWSSVRGLSMSNVPRTRKMVNYAWVGWSQGKLWWKLVAVLTCKSIVKLGYRGERLIEPSSSWFPPKFPSG